jgi:hypothetical protein
VVGTRSNFAFDFNLRHYTAEYATDSVLTQVVLPASGKMLLAASESGTVRSYKFPLTGEFQEYQCHSGRA